jgi:recombination protein RecA
VVDSVAALVPKSELEGEMGDSKMGLHARLMSQAMRKLTASVSKTKTLLIFINQLRDVIGAMPYAPQYITTGGKALKFYSSVRLEISRIGYLKDGEQTIGSKIKAKVAKNKCAAPFKYAEFDILFGQGIDTIGEVIDIASSKEVIKKSGSWYSYNDSKLGQGKDAVKNLLKDNPELFNEIKSKI